MYVDVLFALNFMMDVMVLLGAGFILELPIRWGRIFFAGAIGAFLGCLFTIAGQAWQIKVLVTTQGELITGILLCTVMAKIAYDTMTKRIWVRNVLAVYGVSFLLGGLLSFIQPYMSSRAYVVMVGVAFVLFCLGQFVYKKLREHTTAVCKVNVQMQGGLVSLTALLDTGNLLTVPVVGTPITVVWAEALYPAMTKEQKEEYGYIRQCWSLPGRVQPFEEAAKGMGAWQLVPYKSVGCQAGLLPVLQVPYMYIKTEQSETVIKNALLGLCEHSVSGSNKYEMILNPKLINNSLKGD